LKIDLTKDEVESLQIAIEYTSANLLSMSEGEIKTCPFLREVKTKDLLNAEEKLRRLL
jgi:hypothetical protein